MTTTFADELRSGFRLVAPILADHETQALARARDLICTGAEDRDRILALFVLVYRRGPRQLWAPVLLDLLAPALVECLQGLRPEPPFADEDEIRQQLVMELLRAARRMPMRGDLSGMRLRLMTQAKRQVVRWLRRESRRQRWQQSFESLDTGRRP